ncbi:MAG: RloB family protein [Saprospiraceae bacterium]
MPLLNKLKYQKVAPWRDAKLFLIICEGERREVQYFNYFDGLSRRLKVIAIPNESGKSAPKHLQTNAEKAAREYEDGGEYELWVAMDMDKWQAKDLHDIQSFCNEKGWSTAFSNPCFEVWLYFHFEKKSLTAKALHQCKTWKQVVDKLGNSGFDSAYHPNLIEAAIQNSKYNYEGDGYFPKVGSTQIHGLGEQIYELVKDVLNDFE